MATFLFNEIVFGPVKSRRLGNSLGINLLPTNKKICNFNCIYCECGFSDDVNTKEYTGLPTKQELFKVLSQKLGELKKNRIAVDTITFAGNGEPTLHPEFASIIEELLALKSDSFPDLKVAVLSNATRINLKPIRDALKKVDYNILKLDSLVPETIKLLNCPSNDYAINEVLNQLQNFGSGLSLQTMFVRGTYQGHEIDNTRAAELDLLLEAYARIKPELVMIYSIARDTPVKTLSKVSSADLRAIGNKIEALGIPVHISA